jgi:hypothetical protein
MKRFLLNYLCHCRGNNALYKVMFEISKVDFGSKKLDFVSTKLDFGSTNLDLGSTKLDFSKSLHFVPGPFRILEMAPFCDFPGLIS